MNTGSVQNLLSYIYTVYTIKCHLFENVAHYWYNFALTLLIKKQQPQCIDWCWY